jgi:hypothetical protein
MIKIQMNSNEIFSYDAEKDSISILKLSSKEERFSFYLNDEGKLYKIYEGEIISDDAGLDSLDPFYKLVFFESRNVCLEFRKRAIKARMDWVRGEIATHTSQLNMYAKLLEKDMEEVK